MVEFQEMGARTVRKVVIETDLKAAKALADQVLTEAEHQGYTPEAIFAIKLAIEEALINAIEHGNCNDCSKHVTVEYEVDDRRVVIEVTDEGEGFPTQDVPDPTMDEHLECPCGRGVMLMRVYMDVVQYSQRGNAVRMVKLNR